jgi:glycosyltransferase involved in cell wall biosynthesis
MKKIVIWESHSTLEGGQKVGLEILDALKDTYECIFFVPAEGPLTEEIRKRSIKYKIIPVGFYSEGKKGIKDVAKLIYCSPKVLIDAYRYLKKNNIDLIYSNGSRTFIWSSILGRLMSIPVIWHVHNFFKDKKTRGMLDMLGRSKSVIKAVFVSKAVREQFRYLKSKSAVIYNGLNIQEHTKSGHQFDLRGKYNISSPAKIVSTISWISEPKNIALFIRAIPYVLKQFRDVHFLIIGGVKEGHGKYYDSLRSLADELAVNSHLTFMGYCDDISALLHNIHVNCITSLESFSLVIPESYFAGVPVIGPDKGGPPELIKDHETGLIYRFGNEKDLADKILLLLKDDNMHSSLSGNCKTYAAEFDIAKFSGQIKTLIDQTLET